MATVWGLLLAEVAVGIASAVVAVKWVNARVRPRTERAQCDQPS